MTSGEMNRLARDAVAAARFPRRDLEDFVEQRVIPVAREDPAGLLRALAVDDAGRPVLAEALLQLHADPLAYLSRTELMTVCLKYVTTLDSESSWAFDLLTFAEMGSYTRYELTLELLETIREDQTDALWLVGDGPMAEIEMVPELNRRLEAEATTNAKLALVRRLIQELP